MLKIPVPWMQEVVLAVAVAISASLILLLSVAKPLQH